MIASKNDSWALVLMLKKFFIWEDFGAPFIMMTTFEHNFAQKIPGHPVHPVELTFVSAKRTGIRILLEPMGLALAAQRFLAGFAFNWVFENVIANTANQLGQECLNMGSVVYFFLLKAVFRIDF